MRQNNTRQNDMRQNKIKYKKFKFSKYFLLILVGTILSYFIIQYIEKPSIIKTVIREQSYIFLIPLFYIIIVLFGRALKKSRLLRSDIYDVDEMSGTDFELALFYHFKKLGYRVKLTPITHDFGADLILKHKRRITVVQAKRWNESVGIKAVQEVVGAIRYYHATDAIVITNSIFTKSAKQLAAANDVILFDRNALIYLFEEGILEENEEEYEEEFLEKENKERICPFCNSRLVLRSGNYGKFYGCSNYPICKYTKNV